MRTLNDLGNDLYTGKTSIPFVGKRKLWVIIAIVLVIVSAIATLVRCIAPAMEAPGASQFTVSSPETTDQQLGSAAVNELAPDSESTVTCVGESDVRVQTSTLSNADTRVL